MAGLAVLNDSYQVNLAGIATPKGNDGRLRYLSEFLDEIKRTGAMQKLIDEAGLHGVEVAQ